MYPMVDQKRGLQLLGEFKNPWALAAVSTMDRFSTNPIVSGGCLEEKRRQFSSAMAVASAIAREFGGRL